MKRLSVESNARKSTEETPNSVLVMTRGSLENPSIPMESNRSVFKTRGSLESPKIPMESNISAVKSRGPLEILPMPLESERSMIKSDRIKSGLFEKEIIPAIRTSFSKENKSQTHELDFLKPSGVSVIYPKGFQDHCLTCLDLDGRL